MSSIPLFAAFALSVAIGCGGVIYIPEPKDDPGQTADDASNGGGGDTVSGGGGASDDGQGDLPDGDTDPSGGDADGGNGSDTGPDTGDGDAGQGDDACDDGKAAVCHSPPAEPSNAHVICVSEEAVAALLEHGDTLGPCESGRPDDGPGPGDGQDQEPGTEPVEDDPVQTCGEHDDKLLICHATNGNGAGARTICIGSPASDAHMDHGDLSGACH